MASNAFFQYLVLLVLPPCPMLLEVVKGTLVYRILSYVNDFAIAPTLGRAAVTTPPDG
jgi:hypothetical protein